MAASASSYTRRPRSLRQPRASYRQASASELRVSESMQQVTVVSSTFAEGFKRPNVPDAAKAPPEVEQSAKDDRQTYHGETMSSMTREEMTAHIQASEARMDARVSRIELLVEHQNETADRLREDVEQARKDMLASAGETRSEMKQLKWWILGTGLSVVLGIAAFNSTVLSNMVASFESGKNTAQSLEQTKNRIDEVARQLAATQAAMEAAAKAASK